MKVKNIQMKNKKKCFNCQETPTSGIKIITYLMKLIDIAFRMVKTKIFQNYKFNIVVS